MTTAELRLQVASVEEIAGDAALYEALLAQLPPGPWSHCIFCGGITRGGNVCPGHQDLVDAQ